MELIYYKQDNTRAWKIRNRTIFTFFDLTTFKWGRSVFDYDNNFNAFKKILTYE